MASRKKKVGIYAGTFDPITKGHMDIIMRAAEVFDEVIIAVSTGEKKTPLFSVDERVEIINQVIETELCDLPIRVKVSPFDGLLVDFAKASAGKVTLVRGIRDTSDFNMEKDMAEKNAILDCTIDSVYFMTSDKCRQISSSFVKLLANFSRKDEMRQYTPRASYFAMKRKYGL